MVRRKSAPNAARTKNRTLDRKILLLQQADMMLPKLAFARLVRKILQQYRVTTPALAALQEASGLYLTYLFSDANLLAYHQRRETLDRDDIRMVLYIRRQCNLNE